ncbi:MAG: antibiotic biosynthesis monooxygenase [Alicyclobacillaceae bacterium]|jgi:heme oxygenase (staphylobilin-producing)|uniref:antibiotic biosynthesis monooxygenase family protein n=1 Tax=Alicyclobacillus sp. SP_1 TaxID=2942475 RepID=UPI002157362F|nr:antibiotic biosynthesis monooxygenase [Alicyclobacillus sp. SP_1]MCY0888259.1 antibiotic biosynthesis monooxygenase [Alicyclobacillaceae bacterium]MCY0894834.1 antibiotic biosynthesis monooxygenase [Alicyclobacillaceae bacterium]
MFHAHNRIESANGQGSDLEQRFQHAAEHMKQVPGFVKFEMLRASDDSHYLVTTVWESEKHFHDWVKSPHFRAAHGGNESAGKATVSTYHVVI